MNLYFSNTYQQPQNSSYPRKVEIFNKEQLREETSKHDFAFAKFKDGYTQKGEFRICHRKLENFIESDTVFADVDNDKNVHYTINNLLSDGSKWNMYILTSKSHTSDKNRFHVIFPLGVNIYDVNQHRKLLEALHKTIFKGSIVDSNCLESSRYFNAFIGTEVYHTEGDYIYSYLLENKQEEKKYTARKEPEINNALKMSIILGLKKAADRGDFAEYNTWIAVGWTLKKYNFSEDEFVYISDQNSEKLARDKWKSFDINKGESRIGYLMNFVRD